jgi:hypothetical protein
VKDETTRRANAGSRKTTTPHRSTQPLCRRSEASRVGVSFGRQRAINDLDSADRYVRALRDPREAERALDLLFDLVASLRIDPAIVAFETAGYGR